MSCGFAFGFLLSALSLNDCCVTHGLFLVLLVFQRYDPNFMAASLDEAYLDVTEVCREKGTNGEEVCET